MNDTMTTIDDLDVAGRRVLLRADFNVPLEPAAPGTGARVADDTRIRAALPTISELRGRGARLVLVSHLGRPKGHDPALSMRPVADRLAELTAAPVILAPAVIGREVSALTESLGPGEMLMLENVRYEPGETRNDPELVTALAELADMYVNDAFGTAHRAHASTEGIAHRLPSAAGRLMEREVRTLSAIVDRPDRPLTAVLGGAKVSDKIGVVERFLELADVLCIGGAMCFPFLAAEGHAVGDSLCPPEDLEPARRALSAAARSGCRLELPRDLVLGELADGNGAVRVLDGVDVPDGWVGLDIGPRTAARYAREVRRSATVFWNGPMGRFELEPFAEGTHAVAYAIAATCATTVVGGGETIEAMRSARSARPRHPPVDRRRCDARAARGPRAPRRAGPDAHDRGRSMTILPGPAFADISRVCLIVMDGWGIAPAGPGNAIAQARTPVFDELWASCPHAELDASGPSVGLPDGQMGNSEVGHLTLGAGAVVPQTLTLIDEALSSGQLAGNEVLREALTATDRVHLLGMVSDGGVHSGFEHLRALIELAAQLGTTELVLHCFTDGRDTSPTAGEGYLRTVEGWCRRAGIGRVASVVGRYWAMDRDRRWDRTQAAYDLIVHGRAAHHAADAASAASAAYERGETDEFIAPTLVGADGRIRPQDSVVCFNFRPDRMRQIVRALAEPGFGETDEELPGWHGRGGATAVRRIATMTEYQPGWPYPVAFASARPVTTLGEVLAAAGSTQLHVAETEKYAHVTYFLTAAASAPTRANGASWCRRSAMSQPTTTSRR